jgi:hypothetical protein
MTTKVKLSMIRGQWHVIGIGETRSTYRILAVNSQETRPLWRSRLNGRTILLRGKVITSGFGRGNGIYWTLNSLNYKYYSAIATSHSAVYCSTQLSLLTLLCLRRLTLGNGSQHRRSLSFRVPQLRASLAVAYFTNQLDVALSYSSNEGNSSRTALSGCITALRTQVLPLPFYRTGSCIREVLSSNFGRDSSYRGRGF